MSYSIKCNELLLDNERVSASEIWSYEQSSSVDVPRLSNLGLWFNPSFASVSVRLEKSESGDCGIVNIYAEDTYGHAVLLAPDHQSDHVIIENAVLPLHRDEIEGIAHDLSENNV